MRMARRGVRISPAKWQRMHGLPMPAISLVVMGSARCGVTQMHMGRAPCIVPMPNRAESRHHRDDQETTCDENRKPTMLSMGIDHITQ
jgi:hypothetical protein